MNANLFNGKGEISNIEINCSIINEQLRHMTPYVEFERIHISNLSFHVSSWTNLRNSPIRIDIDDVRIVIVEPMYYETDQTKRKRIRQVTIEELTKLMKDGVIPKPRQSSYNLLDRILDNLIVEIRSLHMTYQPIGIFKTRRAGPWTPPTLLIQLFGTRWITIDEYGLEVQHSNTNHNHRHHTQHDTTTNKTKQPHARHQQQRKKDGTFYIDKRFETDYKVSLIYTQPMPHKNNTGDDPTINNSSASEKEELERETIVIPIISSSLSTFNGRFTNNSTMLDPRKKMNVHFIIQRRIRDGEYLAVQIDMTIPLVDVLLFQQNQPPMISLSSLSSSSTSSVSTTPKSISNAKILSALVHFATAMQCCLRKDRAFTDPLRPVGSIPNQPPSSLSISPSKADNETNFNGDIVDEFTDKTNKSSTSGDADSVNPNPDDGAVPLPILDLTLADGLSDSSSSSGDDDNNNDSDDVEREPSTDNQQEVETTENRTIAQHMTEVPIDSIATDSSLPTRKTDEKKPVTTPLIKSSTSSGRPLLVFSNGMIVHDKFTFSLNIHEIQMSAHYDTIVPVHAIDGDFRFIASGVVVEMIWPIATMVSVTIFGRV